MLNPINYSLASKIAQVNPVVVTSATKLAALVIIALCLTGRGSLRGDEPANPSDGYRTLNSDQLVAWCIVPFDANKRGPAERAKMVVELGLKRVAYDWRDVHVPTFEQEIIEYKKRGIDFFAFWSWHPTMAELVKKYEIRPQFWLMLPTPKEGAADKRVAEAVDAILPRVRQVAALGCKVGIYNHGGWSGEPDKMVAVCKELIKRGHENVGIVYNFHHGHEHVHEFAAHLKAMKPHLLCVNLNGMNDNAAPKILPIGSGEHELTMIRELFSAGYNGPIGILDHRSELDSAESLRMNLDGLAKIRQQLGAE